MTSTIINSLFNTRIELLVNDKTRGLTSKWDIEKAPTESVLSSLGKAEYERAAIVLFDVYKEQSEVVGVPIKDFSVHVEALHDILKYRTITLLSSENLMEHDLSFYSDPKWPVYVIPKDAFFECQNVPRRD